MVFVINFWLFISVERQSFIDKILYECNDFKILIRVKIYYFAKHFDQFNKLKTKKFIKTSLIVSIFD